VLEAPGKGHEAFLFTLLIAGALLLAVALTTLSPAAWVAGAGALITSSAVDARHQRRLAALSDPFP